MYKDNGVIKSTKKMLKIIIYISSQVNVNIKINLNYLQGYLYTIIHKVLGDV